MCLSSLCIVSLYNMECEMAEYLLRLLLIEEFIKIGFDLVTILCLNSSCIEYRMVTISSENLNDTVGKAYYVLSKENNVFYLALLYSD